MTNNTKSFRIRYMPKDLKRRFRDRCHNFEERTMKSVIEELMTLFNKGEIVPHKSRKKRTDDTEVFYLHDLPRNLVNAFKAHCVFQDKEMEDTLIRLIEGWVR